MGAARALDAAADHSRNTRAGPSGAARVLLRARILLKANELDGGEGWSDTDIAAALETSTDTVARTRQRLVEGGIEGALKHHHAAASARAGSIQRKHQPIPGLTWTPSTTGE